MNGRLGWSTLLTPPILMPKKYVESRFAGKACNLYFQAEYIKQGWQHPYEAKNFIKIFLEKNGQMSNK